MKRKSSSDVSGDRTSTAVAFCFAAVLVSAFPQLAYSVTDSPAPESGKSQPILLKPMAYAPLGSKGSAAEGSGTLYLRVEGLRPGYYEIHIQTEAERRPTFLGVFVVGNPGAAPDRTAGANSPERDVTYQSSTVVAETSIPLPPRPSRSSIVSLTISQGGNAVLVGGRPSP